MCMFCARVLGDPEPAPIPSDEDPAGVTAATLALPENDDDDAGSPFENGNSTPATTVALPADTTISGVLWGTRWNTNFITYSDPDSTADYQAGYSTTAGHPNYFSGFAGLSASQLTATHAILNQAQFGQLAGALNLSVEAFTNLGIDYAGSGTGNSTIRLANTNSVNTARVADFPQNNIHGGDVWFGASGVGPVTGGYHYATVIHELGHALGLKHGHQNINNFGGGAPVLPAASDSMEYSIMTYRSYVGGPTTGYTNEAWGYAQTFMMYDIRALQQLYGADFTANGGNTTYTWSPTGGETFINGQLALDPGGNRIFATIWDGNGTDTYDLENYSTNLQIDLNPGAHSVFSSAQLADLDIFGGNIARGNIFNALQFNGDARSLIENALGGSGNDSLVGNNANNLLTGNGGDDTLRGGNGNDTLEGSAGNDVIEGQGGTDTERGGGGNDRFVFNVGFGYPNSIDGVDGNDTFDFSAIGGGFSGTGIVIDLVSGYSDIGGTMSLARLENVLGSDSSETIRGGAGANSLIGNGGDDLIEGRAGNDRLEGGLGNDILNGGAGKDILIGGAGNDRFDFNLVSDSPFGVNCDALQSGGGGAAFDLPGSGGMGGDRIDVFDIDANITQGGNQAFIFGLPGTKGHLWCVNSGATTRVLGNVDNDAAVEFQINIVDGGVLANAYTAADFIL